MPFVLDKTRKHIMTLQVYGEVTRNYIVFDEETGAEVHRAITVSVPKHLPPARAAIYYRIAAFRKDPELLRWLAGLPIYSRSERVSVSRGHIIHRLRAACLTMQEFGPDSGTEMDMAAAIAEFIDEEGKRIKPKPCRTCFASGLLVALEEDNGEQQQ